MQLSRPPPDVNEPERSFTHPNEILETSELTCGQKFVALDRWRTLVEVRLRKSRSPSAMDVALHQALIRARRVMNSPAYWSSLPHHRAPQRKF
jgi:hypothetical protein